MRIWCRVEGIGFQIKGLPPPPEREEVPGFGFTEAERVISTGGWVPGFRFQGIGFRV